MTSAAAEPRTDVPNRLSGKVAIVTGAAHGIGRATAELFAQEGARVVLADIDTQAGNAVANALRAGGHEAVFVEASVASETDIIRTVAEARARFGSVHILVNNAAAFVLKGLEATPDDWHRILDTNVIGTALFSQHASQAMRDNGGGAIVNVSSISAFVAQPQFVTYSATKAAILQMTRNTAMDLAPWNIRVNCVCPGTVLTRASYDHMERTGMTTEEFIATEAQKHLLGRIGEPVEVAYAILFLASDEASFITGTYIMVDGGYTVQ